MTNPNNAVGTNAAYGGRTSVNAFNDNLAMYSKGIISGWSCEPSGGMDVVLGGSGTVRDVAVAEDNAGNKTTINNISGSPISLTIDSAPSSNSRIDLIVAYVDNPPQGTSTIVDNYEPCGIISVQGVVSSTPSEPGDNEIRAAITADGASGVTAYYVVLSRVTITSGTTDLTSDDIATGDIAQVTAPNVDFTPVTSLGDYSTTEQDTGHKWIDGKPIYRKCYTGTITITANTRVTVVLESSTNIENLINVGGYMGYASGNPKGRNSIPSSESNTSGVVTNFSMVYLVADSNNLQLVRFSNNDRGSQPYAVWVEYTKQ